MEVLDESERSFLAYLTCGFCASSIIVRVMTMPHGLLGNAILTDLGPIEVLDYAEAGEIESNGVLEAHGLISQSASFLDKLRKS